MGMKKLLFLTLGIFSLISMISCGEEKLDPYTDEGYDKAKKLLPVEISEKVINGNNTYTIYTTTFKYDDQDRIIEYRYLFGSTIYVYDIAYNETNGTIKSAGVYYSTSDYYNYTYEYTDDRTILEHKSHNGNDPVTNTLNFGADGKLYEKISTENGTSNYTYDSKGNLTGDGTNTFTFDSTKGILSGSKTPVWIFSSLYKEFPFSRNIINNVTLDEENVAYSYTDLNHNLYPTKVIIDNDVNNYLEITYKLSTRF